MEYPDEFYVSLFKNVAELIEKGRKEEVNWEFLKEVAEKNRDGPFGG